MAQATIVGWDKAVGRLITLAEQQGAATDEFLKDEAERIFEGSQELVPRDEEELADSGQVVRPGGRVSQGVRRGILPRGEGGQFAKGGWVVTYGDGGAEDHAIPVHETPSKHDPPSWRGKTVKFTTGQPQFLAVPFKQAVSSLWGRLAAHLRSRLR